MVRIPSKWIVRGILIVGLVLVLASGSIVGGKILATKQQAADMGTPLDPNIKFFGRWDTSNSAIYNSYWPGAYFETSFTGTTVKLRLTGFSAMHISIDHQPDRIYYAEGASGIVNPTPKPLKAGTHTVRVAIGNDTDTLHFKGLILDPGATTVAPPVSARLIEFIGDSITVGATDTNYALSDYAWLASERLGVEHTQIAQGGICLVDNVQCGTPNTLGMSRQYFKLQTSYFSDSPDWDFSRYQATAVVINLGTNDRGYFVDDTLFQSTYIAFLHNIRNKYPKALIFAMEPFNGANALLIQAAIQAATTAGDHNVRYIDTTGWLQSGSDDFSVDGLHPSDAGQVKAANRLEPILAKALG